MNDCDRATLGELCDVSIGRTPRRNDLRYWGGPHPWATIRDLDGGTLTSTEQGITDAAVNEVMPQPVEPNTLLFSFKLSIGKMAFAGRRMHHNEAIAALPIRSPRILDREFLFHALKAKTHYGGANHAVLGKVLNKRKVEAIEIPIPPLDEQRRIVGILNRAAKIERLRTKAAECLREFVPALFVKMFGDPVTNPMGWESQTLGSCCLSIRYGTSRRANGRGEGVPALRMGNVTYGGDLDLADLKHVPLPDGEMLKHGLQPGDILFNRTNSRELVGKTGLWDGRFPAVAASYFIRLRLDQSRVLPGYVWAAMNSAAMKGRLFAMARGAIGQANINARELRSIPLPVPDLELQARFVSVLNDAVALRDLGKQSVRDAVALSASLLDGLLDDSA